MLACALLHGTAHTLRSLLSWTPGAERLYSVQAGSRELVSKWARAFVVHSMIFLKFIEEHHCLLIVIFYIACVKTYKHSTFLQPYQPKMSFEQGPPNLLIFWICLPSNIISTFQSKFVTLHVWPVAVFQLLYSLYFLFYFIVLFHSFLLSCK